MVNFYTDVLTQDEIERLDADPNFWRVDSWTQEQLADNKRWGHYMAHPEKHEHRGTK